MRRQGGDWLQAEGQEAARRSLPVPTGPQAAVRPPRPGNRACYTEPTASEALLQYSPKRARDLLGLITGKPGAAFRHGQEEAIRRIVQGRGRLLVVQKTGWGKSAVYFIAAKLLRETGQGPTLLVSPLLALMRNQIEAAERMGVKSFRIASDNTAEWDSVKLALLRDNVDILLIAPERLANEEFQQDVLRRVAPRIPLLVIDEAHCMSDWGHDFRPDYRRLVRIVRLLPANLRLLCTTATANDRVVQDLREALGSQLQILQGGLNRPSLKLQTIRLRSQAERMAWLAAQVPRLPGHGIIYTLTVRDAERVAAWLRSRGVNVESYTGRTGDRRPELEQALLANRVKALVATTALGMGFDKPDLSFVIHFQAPGSAVAYYQQVGRAGRALRAAYGILLSGQEETDITDYFIDTAFPARDEVQQVIAALEAAPEGLSIPELLGAVNISRGRAERAIKLLALESPAPIAKDGSKWQLTAARLGEEFWKRAERLTLLRRSEQRQMQEYARLQDNHMAFLIKALDGDPGALEEPDLPPLPATVETASVGEAVRFLRADSLMIEPRKFWPSGGLPRYDLRGRIAPEHRAEAGIALGAWGDAGWGEVVKRGKFEEGRFSHELVRACVTAITRWAPYPAPKWVTSVPSFKRPELVRDFARNLAGALGLPFRAALQKSRDKPEQKEMRNSIQQARNLDGALRAVPSSVTGEPVLLVDDIVDSGWTLTVSAWLLKSHGCGEVWPIALASANKG